MIKPITRKNEKVASQEAERKEAEIRNKEFYLIGTETVNMEAIYDPDIAPDEILASDVSNYLAIKAADSFTTAVDGLNMVSIKQLIRRIEKVDAEEAVKMLQAIFLSKGMRTDAEMLDILMTCKPHYESAYDDFMECFLQTDEIDWFLVESWLDECSGPTDRMCLVRGRCIDGEDNCCL
ncbi:MAG: hypothetical protein IKE85_01880 [Mogibacterium sp.]|nr:hypothetical protein [Mogibacterium sp.]